jgi:hypothetical protein
LLLNCFLLKNGRLTSWDLILIHSHNSWRPSGDCGGSRDQTRNCWVAVWFTQSPQPTEPPHPQTEPPHLGATHILSLRRKPPSPSPPPPCSKRWGSSGSFNPIAKYGYGFETVIMRVKLRLSILFLCRKCRFFNSLWDCLTHRKFL